MSRESTHRTEQTAGNWLARRDSGAWSPEDQDAFDAWMNESSLHKVTYLRLKNAWESALRLKALGAGVHSDRPPPPGQWNLSPFYSRHSDAFGAIEYKPKRSLRALVAGCACVALVAAWLLRPPSNTFQTPVGGIASLPMSDGSKVTLNTNTQIKVAMTKSERRIDLGHGEAFFEVAKDPDRPFFVRVGNQRVIALGTKFSVRRDVTSNRDDMHVVVTQGAVHVESTGGAAGNLLARHLTAGHVAHANRHGLMVQVKQLPEAEEQLSWRAGVLVLRDVTLEEAAAEFNRYNERQVVIEDHAAATMRVAGNFRATNVEAFVQLLEQGYPIEVSSRGNEIRVASR